MVKKRGCVILIVLVIGGIGMTGLFLFKGDTVAQIEKKLDINLGENVSIIKTQRKTQNGEEHIKIKCLVNEKKVEEIQEELIKCFGVKRYIEDIGGVPNFQNTCTWWDLDKGDTIACYHKMIEGNHAKTLEIWAFVTEVDNEYYLYVAY